VELSEKGFHRLCIGLRLGGCWGVGGCKWLRRHEKRRRKCDKCATMANTEWREAMPSQHDLVDVQGSFEIESLAFTAAIQVTRPLDPAAPVIVSFRYVFQIFRSYACVLT
jgi:hypothetical protein